MRSSKAGSNAARWFSGWRRALGPHQPDFADFGTAFGLDLSLGAPPADAAPAAPATAVTATPPISAAAAGPRGWRLRLKRRRAA